MNERPLRLLWFNLATDADAPNLGFAVEWINALAPHCEFIDVISMRVGRADVAGNVRVHSLGVELGYSEARRALRFYAILWRLLRTRSYDACFAHMQPLFAAMGAPLLRAYGIPVTLWYTHRAVPLRLRLAERVRHARGQRIARKLSPAERETARHRARHRYATIPSRRCARRTLDNAFSGAHRPGQASGERHRRAGPAARAGP